MVKAGLTAWVVPGEEIPDEFKNRSAFFLELVQGEAGVVPLDPEWVAYVSNWCKENEVLLVVDEVQTGFGRTGSHFVLDQYQNVHPDIVTLGKALGGGYPLGAVISSSERFSNISEKNPFTHLSTFGGNPVSCAAGMQMFQGTAKKKLLQNVRDGNVLAHNVFDGFEYARLRGRGLMLGLVLNDDIDIDVVVQNIWENQVFCGRVLYGSNTIRLYPPLNTTPSDLYNKFSRVKEAVEKSVR
jgi:acetylornithine/succinyldiaminopimelate/putrescine aminotransferase